jgi:hypothetical protein
VRGSRPPSFIFRRHGDGKPDVIFFDFKRQGKWELSYCAENFDSHWTLVGYHDDGSLKPSKFESSAVGTEPAAYRLTPFRQVSGEAASICRRRCRERFQAAIRRIAPQPAALAKNTDAIVQSCWFTPGARTFILAELSKLSGAIRLIARRRASFARGEIHLVTRRKNTKLIISK